MPPTIPTTEPTVLAAGTTWEWTIALTDFPPAEGWTLTYYLTGETSLSFAATPRVTDYAVSVAAATTASVKPGTYQWAARVSNGASTYNARSGTVEVTPDLAVAANSDQRSHTAKMVPILEAEIEARITGTGAAHDSTSIGGISISRMSVAELRAMLSAAKATLARERHGGRLPPYAVTFSAPR